MLPIKKTDRAFFFIVWWDTVLSTGKEGSRGGGQLLRNLPPHECWPSEEEFLVGHLPSTSFPSSSFPLPILAIPKVAGTFGLQQRRRAFPLPLRNFFYLCAVFGWGVEPAAAAQKDGGFPLSPSLLLCQTQPFFSFQVGDSNEEELPIAKLNARIYVHHRTTWTGHALEP